MRAFLPPATDAAFVKLGLLTCDAWANGGAPLEWLGLDQHLCQSFNDIDADLVLAAQGCRLASAMQRLQDLLLSIVGARGQFVASSKYGAKVRAPPAPRCRRVTRCRSRT